MLGVSIGAGTAFDTYRQNIWNQYLPIANEIYTATQNNTLTYEQLSLAISRLNNLLVSFKTYYDTNRTPENASYFDSRFHDFYDPMLKDFNNWNAILPNISPVSTSAMPNVTPLPTLPTGDALTTGAGIVSYGSSPAPSAAATGGEYLPEWLKDAGAGQPSTPSPTPTTTSWVPIAIGAAVLYLLFR